MHDDSPELAFVLLQCVASFAMELACHVMLDLCSKTRRNLSKRGKYRLVQTRNGRSPSQNSRTCEKWKVRRFWTGDQYGDQHRPTVPPPNVKTPIDLSSQRTHCARPCVCAGQMLLIALLTAFSKDSLQTITVSQFFHFIAMTLHLQRYTQLVQPAHQSSQFA